MNSINFPIMFKANSTIINYPDNVDTTHDDTTATKQCIKLLLECEVRELFGDPDFGIKEKIYKFNQNNYILRDVFADELYTKISTFCPQVIINMKNITITSQGAKLYVKIVYRYKKDFTTDTLNLELTNKEES